MITIGIDYTQVDGRIYSNVSMRDMFVELAAKVKRFTGVNLQRPALAELVGGSIEVGKLADLVVLSDNPLTVPEDQLDDLMVMETIKEGVSIYLRPEKLSAISSPAMFGVTLNDHRCSGHAHGGSPLVCGDGCFNHALSVLIGAICGADRRD